MCSNDRSTPFLKSKNDRGERMEASTSKEYGDFAKSLEDELMNFTADFEETDVDAYFAEGTESYRNSDKEDNVVEHSDTTESSSSFDGSDSGDEGVHASEVSSGFSSRAGSAFDFSGPDSLFLKRKKVSPQWRSFIHPLMWRCKWLELQIKKLEGQARKYDRMLEEYNQKDRAECEGSSLEGRDIRPLAFPQNECRGQMLRRKRRRRGEATEDVAAYMSRHNLFSYYEHRRYIREISHNVLKNPAHKPTANDRALEEFKTDNGLGNDGGEGCDELLENILRKIDAIQLRVHNLKSRSEKVMAEDRVKLRISDYLSSSPSLSSPPPTLSYRTPVGNYIASQLLAEYNLGAVLLPSNDEVVDAPQANGAIDNPHLAYGYEHEEEDILIDNQWVREEFRYHEKVKFHSTTRPQPLPPPPPSQTRSTPNLTNTSITKRRKSS